MSLRIVQNWKWLSKTFPPTLCVVGTSDETTPCGICLTSNKNQGIRGGGVWAENCIFWDNFSLEIGTL